MATHYEHGPGCTLGANGKQCADCRRKYPRKSRLITVRLTEAEKARMREVYEKQGIPLSEQVRRGVTIYLKRVKR